MAYSLNNVNIDITKISVCFSYAVMFMLLCRYYVGIFTLKKTAKRPPYIVTSLVWTSLYQRWTCSRILTGWGWFSTLSGSKHLNNTTKIRKWNWRLAFISGAGWKGKKNKLSKKKNYYKRLVQSKKKSSRNIWAEGCHVCWSIMLLVCQV